MNAHRLDVAWGHDTGTHELPMCYVGVPREEVDTAWLLDLRPEVPAVDPAPAKRASRVGRAARRAYTGLVALGLLTITGCTTLGPNGLADVVTQVLR